MFKKYKKLFNDFLTILFGNFGSKLLSFLMMPLYTSVLTTAEYGVSDLISTTVSLLYPVFTLGIGEALNRFLLDKDGQESKYLSISLRIWGAGGLLVLVLSPLLTSWLFQGQYLWDFYGIYCASSLCEILRHYAKGTEKLKIFSASGVLDTAILIASNLLFLLVFKMGLHGLLLATQISGWFTCAFLFISLKQYKSFDLFPIQKKKYINDASKLVKYGIPLSLNSISWWIVISSDKYILLYYHGESYNGIYSVAQKIPSIIVSLVAIFISAWSISSVEEFGSESNRNFFSGVLHKVTVLQVSIAAVLIAFNKLICRFLFTGDFYIAWKYVPILLIANVWYSSVSFLGSIYTASKKTKLSMYTTLVGAFVNIVLNFLLAPKYAIYGVSAATAASYLVTMILRMIDTRKIIKIDMKIRYSVMMFSLLVLEGFLGMLDKEWAPIGAGILCAFILGINYKEGRDSIKSALSGLKRNQK